MDRLLQKFDSFCSTMSRIIFQKFKQKSSSVQKKIPFYEEILEREFYDKKRWATLKSLAFRLKKLHSNKF
jgi:hypothetical protein